jgi:hypothetical protein
MKLTKTQARGVCIKMKKDYLKTKKFQTVEEKTINLIMGRKIPDYMMKKLKKKS